MVLDVGGGERWCWRERRLRGASPGANAHCRAPRQLAIVLVLSEKRCQVKYSLVMMLVLMFGSSSAFAQAVTQVVDPEELPPPPSTYAPPPAASRSGVTFEANLGLGLVWARAGNWGSSDTETALAGLDLGLGGWLRDDMALSVRVAGATFSPEAGTRFTTGFLGLSLQNWVSDHAWIGGGAGLAFFTAHVDSAAAQPDPDTGFGLDLRAGYTFNPGSDNTFNLSIELNPGFFSVAIGSGSNLDVNINSFGLLLGYQHL
jgi:hypothetical protein